MANERSRAAFLLEELLTKTVQASYEELKDSKNCPICQDPYLEGEAPELPLKLRCGHIHGSHCLIKWLSPHSTEIKNTCPLCREPIIDNWLEEVSLTLEDRFARNRQTRAQVEVSLARVSDTMNVIRVNILNGSLRSLWGARELHRSLLNVVSDLQSLEGRMTQLERDEEEANELAGIRALGEDPDMDSIFDPDELYSDEEPMDGENEPMFDGVAYPEGEAPETELREISPQEWLECYQARQTQ